MADNRLTGTPGPRAIESRLMGSRHSFLLLALVAALLVVLISVPPATRVANVEPRRPSTRQSPFGMAPGQTPDDLGGAVIPPAVIDPTSPPCVVMGKEEAIVLPGSERTGVMGAGGLAPPPIPDSTALFSVPRGPDGAPLGQSPTTVTPVAGSPYVVTTGIRSTTVTTSGRSSTRAYVSLQRYEADTHELTGVVAFDNCASLLVAPPAAGAASTEHLWMLAGTDTGAPQLLLEVDPAANAVVWSAPQSNVAADLLDVGEALVFVPPGSIGSASVFDKSSRRLTGSYELAGDLVDSAPNELWVVVFEASRAMLSRLEPKNGQVLTSFTLPPTLRFGAADVHFAGGRIWTQEANAIIQRDAETFAELLRVETGDRPARLDVGADDVWLQTDRSAVRDRVVTYEVELRHLDGASGDVVSVRPLRALPSPPPTAVEPAAELLPLVVDRGGFWYESRRRMPSTGDVLESSETMFRFDGE